MPSKDIVNRSIDAGREATGRTIEAGRDVTKSAREVTARAGDRVESLFRELLQANLEQVEQAQQILEEFVDRSRRNTERLIDAIDGEIRDQLAAMSLATRADLKRLEHRLEALEGSFGRSSTSASPARPSASAPAARSPRKATAKKATATKAPAKKAPAKKAAGARSGAQKAAAKGASPRARTSAERRSDAG